MGQIHGPTMGSPAAIVDESGRLYVNSLINNSAVNDSGLVVMTHNHFRNIQGEQFQAGSYIQNMPLDTSGAIFLCNGSVDLHFAFDARTDGNAIFNFYENTHVDDSGTSLPIYNTNRHAENEGHTINAKAWIDPTVNSVGTLIHSAMFLGGSGTSTKFASATVSTAPQDADWILEAGSCYYFEFINICGRDMNADFNLVMHEHVH